MAFIKAMFGLLLFCIAIGSLISIFIFTVDVIKWHDKEVKVKITPSNAPDQSEDNPTIEESEVKEHADESGEHNTSAFFDFGR